MTIVETAMERAREMSNGAAPDSATTSHYAQRTYVPTLTPVASVTQAPFQPHARIQSRPVKLDLAACRENRLLLSSNEDDEGPLTAYRMLRTRLLHRIRARGWTTIAITSTAPAEGKTLTSLNLAASMARENNSDIVLLDLDMRNPSICKALGARPPRELRSYFEKPQADVEDLFYSIGIERLMIAGQVTSTDRASELLSSNRFEELIGRIKQGTNNPIILIDLPPVLSTDDALVIAPRVDALLLVVSEGQTGRADLKKTTELLAEFPIAGMVLNRSVDQTAAYQYGYGGYGPRP